MISWRMSNIRNEVTIDGKVTTEGIMTSVVTQVYEYLDDITSYSNVHTGEGTG